MEPRRPPPAGAPPSAGRDDAITAVSAVAYGFMGSQALFAALELGLFTELAAGPAPLEELARRLSAEPPPLRALLEACVATGLLERTGDRYRNAPTADRYLVRHARGYVARPHIPDITFVFTGRRP